MSLEKRVERLENGAPVERGPLGHLSNGELVEKAREARGRLVEALGEEAVREIEKPFRRVRT